MVSVFRLNEFNIIATDQKPFERFVSATLLAKVVIFLIRAQDCSFQKILYGDVVGKSSLFKKKECR